MFPLGLRILLGEATTSALVEYTQNKSLPGFSDWSDLNCPMPDMVRRILALVEDAWCPGDTDPMASFGRTDMAADMAWAQCADAMPARGQWRGKRVAG